MATLHPTFEPIYIFPVDYRFGDNSETSTFEIQIFARDSNGLSCCIHVDFYPYFFVSAAKWTPTRTQTFLNAAIRESGAHATHSRIVRKKSIWGFTNGEARPFVMLAFSSAKAYRNARYKMERERLVLYEAGLDSSMPLLRFFHSRDIQPASWLCLSSYRRLSKNSCRTSCDVELSVPWTAIAGASPEVVAELGRPKLVQASWDIETHSSTGRFPDPSVARDVIICIGLSLHVWGAPDDARRSILITHGPCDPIDGVEVIACENEAAVVTSFADVLRHEGVDVLLGWNTHGFDFKYVGARMSSVLLDDDTGEEIVERERFGKILHGEGSGGTLVEKRLSSAAYGDNTMTYLDLPGIFQLDLLTHVRKEVKLASYKLNNVAELYLGQNKVDLAPKEIFRLFEAGGAEAMATIASYCATDCVLPARLCDKLNVLNVLFEMANATYVAPSFLLERGQGIKCLSQITRAARAKGFLCPDLPRKTAAVKFVGATVLNPVVGAHMEPVACLDFASLYPSIIRAHGLCFASLVMEARFADIPGVDYLTVEVPDMGTFKFAQGVETVIPDLLTELTALRKKARKRGAEAKAAGDAWTAALAEASQLALKVSANSMYGALGAGTSALSCPPIAASVTTIGRGMLEKSAAAALELVPGSELIYGDSVADYTPVYIRCGGGVSITTFESLAKEVEWSLRDDGKEYAELSGIEIWSDGGWAVLERIIRHALDPSKTMIRVLTHTGLVDVTSDHSLLTPGGEPIKPGQVDVGVRLMHHDPPAFTLSPGVAAITDVNEARIMGFFGASKMVPTVILAASANVRQSFWEGLYDADGDKDELGFNRIDQKSHASAATFIALGHSLGFSVSLNTRSDKPFITRMTFIRATQRRCPDAIKKIHPIAYEGGRYVYDATTSNHHFAAGPGRMVVHNTDSIMIKFKIEDPKKQLDVAAHYEVAARVANEISALFKAPIELEFEKVYIPYLLFGKKRYASLVYEPPDPTKSKVDYKGIQLVRRDSCPFVKRASSQVLDKILRDRDGAGALETAAQHARALLAGEVDVHDLELSKALRADYKAPLALPHVAVARRRQERSGEAVMHGERVPYIFVVRGNRGKGDLQVESAEDPAFAAAHGLAPDTLLYYERHFTSPILTFLEVLGYKLKDLETHPAVAPLLETARARRNGEYVETKRIRTNTTNKQREITSFFTKR